MTEFLPPGFPIQKSAGQRIVGSSPRLIAAVHVFHRLSSPRHPPDALSILAFLYYKRFSQPYATSLFFLSFPYVIVNEQALAGRRICVRVKTSTRVDTSLRRKSLFFATFSTSSTRPKARPRLTPYPRKRLAKLVEAEGIEPTTSSLQSWRSPS